jgi:HK97 family phage portal protein
MRLLDRLLGRDQRETRASEPSWDALSGLDTATGAVMTHRGAENLSAVLGAVNAISTALASLPAYVQRQDADRLETDPEHPVQRLIDRGPNDWQSWPDFIEWTAAQALLSGNALAEIVTDGRGAPVELRPIPWSWVSVQLLPSGRLAYDIVELTALYGGTGRQRRLLQGEVLHLRDRTDEGLVGKSRLSRARSVIDASAQVQQFANSVYRNGVAPSGILEADERIEDNQLQRLKDQFARAFSGSNNAGSALVLDQGVKWKQLGVSPEDAELLNSRRFSVEEIARIFSVPPPIIGDLSHGTFTNTETVGRWFATNTLSPWIRKIEAEFKRSVFSEASRPTHRLTFDMSAFLRGDPEQRWQAHKIAAETGILDLNEIRRIEGWNPRDGQPAQAEGEA